MSSQTVSSPRDANSVPALLGTSSADNSTPVKVYADPVTHRLLVSSVSAGIASINGDSTSAQLLVVGTAGTDFAIVDNGTGTHTFNLPTASASNRGALSSADWSTFNGKQASGNYITALTGDVTASGPGSVAATLATVNSNVGTFGSATATSVVTVNGKGLVTAASNTTITPAVGSITGLGTGVATFLATPSSSNLASAITDETGSGALVFGTNPTIAKPVLNATNPTAQTYTPSAAGTATLDLSLANQHYITMPAGNITIALSSDTNNQIFYVTITQDAIGSRTVTWFTTIRWAGGTPPTLTTTASKRDAFIFARTGSGTYDGFVVGQNI